MDLGFRFVKIWLGGGPAALLPGTAAKVAKKKRLNGVGGQFFSVKFFQKPYQNEGRVPIGQMPGIAHLGCFGPTNRVGGGR